MLDVLLINPGKRKKVSLIAFKERLKYPPMSLMYLASYLRKENFNVKILDMNMDFIEDSNLLKLIKEKTPKVIGITSVTLSIYEAYRLAGLIKANFNIPLIIGGCHATFTSREILNKSKFDVVVIGEGEESFYEVVRAVKEKRSFEGIDGISFKNNEKIIDNKPRVFIEDLDKLPFPARDLVKFEDYGAYAFTVLSSRGCPFRCSFCQSSRKDGIKWRHRTADNVIEEIKEVLERYPKIKKLNGPKGKKPLVHFIDDNFMMLNKRVEEIAKKLIEDNIKVYWSCDARADTIAEASDEFLNLLKDSGCIHLYMGIESGSEDTLKSFNKRINKGQVLRAAKRLKKKSIYFTGSFIFGHVDEGKEEMKKTISLAKKMDPTIATFSILVPFPGTPVFDEYKEKGLIKSFNYSEYKFVTNKVVRHKEDLMKWSKKAHRSFYLRPRKCYFDIKIWKLFKDFVF